MGTAAAFTPSGNTVTFLASSSAPTPMPTDGKMYSWNEATTSWVEMAEAV